MAFSAASPASALSFDERVDAAFRPVARAFSEAIFFSIELPGGTELPLIVVWLIAGAVFCTLYFRFINVRGFVHAIRLVKGDFEDPNDPGEVSHFQALATAISGTVGVGNIAHVAVAISVGGPGAIFWLVVAGFLGMSSKFVECTLGVKYRQENPDGTVFGGPMHYLGKGLAKRGFPRLGRVAAIYYAVCIVIGCFGVGSMFQANQAFVQFVEVTGREASPLFSRGWLFGLVLALVVATVVVGGIKNIVRVTDKLVPFMALLYGVTAVVVIVANLEKLPWAVGMIVRGAFVPEGMAGGAIAVMVLGFRRAAFSNEAGIGSASIAHAAVRTKEPVTEGLVALLEPFIDTVVVCTLTGLVITLTVYDPGAATTGISGVELTSRAFASTIPWFPYPLALVVILFAFSTMIAWSYYGLAGWLYVFGNRPLAKHSFHILFCASVVLGCVTQLDAVLDFSDAMIFALALVNVAALYVMAPEVKRELEGYWARMH